MILTIPMGISSFFLRHFSFSYYLSAKKLISCFHTFLYQYNAPPNKPTTIPTYPTIQKIMLSCPLKPHTILRLWPPTLKMQMLTRL